MKDLADIEADIISITSDASLYAELNFSHRANAIDFIDFHIIDRIESLQQSAKNIQQIEVLAHSAKKLKQELENTDTKLFKRLRGDICNGVPFIDILCQYIDRNTVDQELSNPGYDNLDNFINCLLCCDALPEATMNLEDEMVFYQQTPARIIFQMAGKLHPDDMFFDIGSGLGQVGILVNLLTGAKTIGVEYETAYCDYAIKSAAQLNLTDVEFLNIDARKADYSGGTVFFMYTPFGGNMLLQVLDILRQHAAQKVFRLFTYGPCSPHVAKQSWLQCINGSGNNIYKLYEFRSTRPFI